MENKVFARLKRTKFKKVLRQLKAGAFPKNRLHHARCEATIIDNQVTFNTPWAEFSLEAETIGTAKATFPIVDVSDVINTFKSLTISITVTEGRVQFESFSVSSNTCFFENDKILRSIILPVNNNEADLVRLLNGKYTREELVFNKLWSQAVAAETRFNSAINSAYLRLKKYGVTYDDLEKLAKEKADLNRI